MRFVTFLVKIGVIILIVAGAGFALKASAFNYSQDIKDTQVATSTSPILFRLPAGLSGTLYNAVFNMSTVSGATAYGVVWRVDCFTDSNFSNQNCPEFQNINSASTTLPAGNPSIGQDLSFDFSSTTPLTFLSYRFYILELASTGGIEQVRVFGESLHESYDSCGGGGFPACPQVVTGTPYFILNSEEFEVRSRFQTLNPTEQEIVATTTVPFSATYFYNSALNNFDRVGFEVYRADNNFSLEYRNDYPIFEGQSLIAQDVVLDANGAYIWRAFMQNATSSDTLATDFINFYVISNPYPSLIGASTTDTFSLATSTCSFTNITGCFQNALIFAFYPSQEVLNKFASLKDEISKKPPFGYVSMITGTLGNLSSTASSTFILQTEPNIMAKIITPMRTATSVIFYLFFGVWFYNRVRKIEI